jgi:hypothetical protein
VGREQERRRNRREIGVRRNIYTCPIAHSSVFIMFTAKTQRG